MAELVSPSSVRGEREGGALYRLMAWLSPAYPVGAFSYSSGIEWAVEAGDIRDAETLARLARRDARRRRRLLRRGAVRARLSRRRGGDDKALRAVAELAAALAPTKERHLETTAQGNAFVEATAPPGPAPRSTG